MRISDWSSDVCSSDLLQLVFGRFILVVACCEERRRTGGENEGVHIWFRDRHYGLLAIRPGETLRSAAGCACGGPACDGYFRPAAEPTGEPIAMVRGPVTRHRVLERSSAIQRDRKSTRLNSSH